MMLEEFNMLPELKGVIVLFLTQVVLSNYTTQN